MEGSSPSYDIAVDTVRSGVRSLRLKSQSYYTYCERSINNETNTLIVGFGVNVSRINNNNHYFFSMGHDDEIKRIEFRFVDSKLQIVTKDNNTNYVTLA